MTDAERLAALEARVAELEARPVTINAQNALTNEGVLDAVRRSLTELHARGLAPAWLSRRTA